MKEREYQEIFNSKVKHRRSAKSPNSRKFGMQVGGASLLELSMTRVKGKN